MSGEQDRKGKLGPDTRDVIASARTVPSDTGLDPVASAPTMLAAAATTPSMAPRARGELLGGRYEILGELGRGGEGVVYRARDLKADAVVALKLLQHDEGSELRLQRFRRELQMARKVTHPNVVRIHDLVELPGRFGLSMELVDGEALDERIARGPLSRDEVVRLATDLARALAAAHEAGVTHRDLKPGNVLLRRRDGHAMVTDFGVSRAHEAAQEARTGRASTPPADGTPLKLTREGAIIGTPQYMAPEQLEGRTDIGPPVDVYAFGMVVYEAATGRRLHAEAQTVGELRARRLEAAAPPLRDKRPDLPRRLCEIVDRCLAREPEGRFPSGKELAEALGQLTSRATGSRAPLWIAAAVATIGGAAALAVSRHPSGAAPTTPASSPAAAAPAPPPGDRPTTPPLSLHLANVRRVTFGDACEEFPSFTPDGRAIVYDGTVGADSFIYRLDLADGATPKQVTHVRGWDIAASLSPAGDRMAFVRFEGAQIGAFVAPIDESAPPHLVVRGAVRPSWTRDGKAIWAGSGAPLAAYDADTGALVRATKGAPNVRTAETIELPGGSLLAALPLQDSADASLGGVALFRPEGGLQWLLTGNVEEVLGLSPDGRHALTSRPSTMGVELMDVPLDGSPATSLASSGVMARKGLAFSPDGRRMTWSACTEVPQVAGADPRGRTLTVLKDDLLGPKSLASVPGTSTIAVVSARAGKPEPWIVDPSGRVAPRAIPIGSLSASDIAVSGDGSRFVISVPADGLYIGSLHGDPQLRRLTRSSWDSLPAFRFGDREVVYTQRSSDAPPRVMSVPVDGGEPTPLLEAGSDDGAPSPVADRIAYVAGKSSAEVVPMLWDGATGTARPLSPAMTTGRYGYMRFSPDGRRLALVRGDTDVVEVDVASGAIVRTLTTPTGDQLAHPMYGPTGLVIVRVHWQGNIWLADVAPP